MEFQKADSPFCYSLILKHSYCGNRTIKAVDPRTCQATKNTGISNLLAEVFREAVQEMLKAEMNNHLGYQKHTPKASTFSNSRNGKAVKKLEVSEGSLPLKFLVTEREILIPK